MGVGEAHTEKAKSVPQEHFVAELSARVRRNKMDTPFFASLEGVPYPCQSAMLAFDASRKG